MPNGIPLDTTELYLDSNDIVEIPIDTINKLHLLTKLYVFIQMLQWKYREFFSDLSNNRIDIIENDTFANHTQLATLILSYNKLQCLEARAFVGLHSLRILSLHGNDLSTLPETAFADLNNMTHVIAAQPVITVTLCCFCRALGSNSLYCDCHLLWFSRWIKSKFVEAGIARCDAPSALRNQLVLSADNHQFTYVYGAIITVIRSCLK